MIGSALIHALLYANQKLSLNLSVFALIRDERKAKERLAQQIMESPFFHMVKGTAEDMPFCSEPIDYIVHGASPTASDFFIRYPVETIQTSVIGTLNAMELAREKAIKGAVYLSSMEVYGEIRVEEQLTEDKTGYMDPLNVRNSYSESKRIGETICASYAKEYSVPVCSVRLAQTFGPGVAQNDKRIFAMMARSALKREPIILSTKGESRRACLYISEAVTAILCLLLRGKPGRAYNAANPQTYCSVYEMAKTVATEVAGGEIDVIIGEDDICEKYPRPSYLKLDISQLASLGWKPSMTLSDMYRRMMTAMESEQDR